MLNHIVLVGRLAKEPEVKELENEKKVAVITLGVPRNYKNTNGVYDTDFIDIVLYRKTAETTAEYCHKGDVIGIKGAVQKLDGEELKIVAEKVTFLASRKED